MTDLDTVRRELELYQPTLAAKPQIVAADKMDAVDDEARVTRLEKRAAELGLPFFRISGVTGEGVPGAARRRSGRSWRCATRPTTPM